MISNGARCCEAWYDNCPHMKSFLEVQGAVFQKSPWPPEAKKKGARRIFRSGGGLRLTVGIENKINI
jgi:hypothetical protein